MHTKFLKMVTLLSDIKWDGREEMTNILYEFISVFYIKYISQYMKGLSLLATME